MLESVYQARLIRRLRQEFPDCVILKNDTDYQQGIPDLVIFFGACWAMLEAKASRDADIRPNQEYWVGKLNEMSYAAFIYPENESEVIDELREALQLGDCATRVPQS